MKKLAIVSAVAAASLSSTAHAIFPIPQIVVFGSPVTATCPGTPPAFEITTAAGLVQMNGDICLEPSGAGVPPLVRLGFHTVTGTYFATPPTGTLFDIGGSIQIDVQTTNGYFPYSTIAVSPTNPIDCTAATGITGLQVPFMPPGHYDPMNPPTAALAVCSLNWFGSQLFIL